LKGERELLAAFERYRAGSPGVCLQGLAQMFSDLHLLPSPLSYAKIRTRFRSGNGGEGQLNYSSFLEALVVLARFSFPDLKGDSTDKLIAAMRQLLPAPSAHITSVLDQGDSSLHDDDDYKTENVDRVPSLKLSAVAKGSAGKSDDVDGLDEALRRVKQDAQRKLQKLAEEFAGWLQFLM